MAQMNAGIILGGATPDFLGSFGRGQQLGRGNALAELYRAQGDKIASGDAQALNALARFDPRMSLQVQGDRQGLEAGQLSMDRTRQAMAFDAETMEMKRAEARRAGQEYAARIGAQQAAAEARELDGLISSLAMAHQQGPEAFAGVMQQFGGQLSEAGIDPASLTHESFPMYAAGLVGAREGLQAGLKMSAAPDRGDRYKVVGNSLFDLQAEGGPSVVGQGQGMSRTVYGPDGSIVYSEGAGVPRQPSGQVASDPGDRSVPAGVDFNDATGARGFAVQIANTVSDAIGAGLVSPENERATQAMQNLATNTMVALADGVAGRPSNFLLEEFQKLASQPNSIWQGEGRTRERLNQTRSMISQAISMNEDIAALAETPSLRTQARANISRLSRLLADYDAVIESFGARQGGNVTSSGIKWEISE